MRLWIILGLLTYTSIFTIPAPDSGVITQADVQTQERECIINNVTDRTIECIIVSIPADMRALYQEKPPVNLYTDQDGSLRSQTAPGMPELRTFKKAIIAPYTRKAFTTQGAPIYVLFDPDKQILQPQETERTHITYNGKPLVAHALYTKNTISLQHAPHAILTIFANKHAYAQRYAYYR